MSTPSAVAELMAVRILNPSPICICGAECGLCSCTWFPLLPCAWGVGVLPVAWGVAARRRGAVGGGRGPSGGATPPGRVTRSGRNFKVARALLRLSKFDHLTLCHLSNTWRKLSLKSYWIRQRRAAGKVGCWRACTISLGLTPAVSSSRRNIL